MIADFDGFLLTLKVLSLFIILFACKTFIASLYYNPILYSIPVLFYKLGFTLLFFIKISPEGFSLQGIGLNYNKKY